MINEILPQGIVCAETLKQTVNAYLFPEEESGVQDVGFSRRREFANGRGCARSALCQLGLPPVAVPRGPNREPRWPPGVVGSISHCEGYCVAATGYESSFITIGIDAEVNSPLPEGVLGEISSVSEQRRIELLSSIDPGIAWDRLLFSAKESVYKAWFPINYTWLDFEDADVEIDSTARSFIATLSRHDPRLFSGRWLVRDNLVLTAIAVLR